MAVVAPVTPMQSKAPEMAASAMLEGDPPKRRKRKELPRIDLDQSIEEAKEAMKRAVKAMADARAQAKNERRKKARLLKKAATLSPADLERIAILKRCGLWDPNLGRLPDVPVTTSSSATQNKEENSSVELSNCGGKNEEPQLNHPASSTSMSSWSKAVAEQRVEGENKEFFEEDNQDKHQCSDVEF